MAAGADGRGRLRASDADRDQAVDVLTAAFVRRQLTKDEFDLRVGQVLAARTYADLDALTDGLLLPLLGQPVATGAEPDRRDLAAREPSAGPPGRSETPALVRVAQAAWNRHRLVFLGVGLLLMAAGVTLPSTVAFIAGILVVGLSAPQALPSTPEAAMVRTWLWLHRR